MSYEDLLPYLVRRMLENGANTSFVSQIRNADVATDQLTRDVVAMARSGLDKAFPLSLPPALYGDHRVNSRGVDLSRFLNYRAFHDAIPPVFSPEAQISPAVSEAFSFAKNGFGTWSRMPADLRAQTLERAADLIEQHTGKMMRLLHSEAKKTVGDALAEIREAVDFCRYYASEGRRICGEDGQVLAGPTGERNTLFLRGRGVFVTISPWNFPLATFLGQVAAALMAGNAVLAKPAEQTPKIADFMVSWLHQAGVPEDALICMHGDGTLGAELVAHRLVVREGEAAGLLRAVEEDMAEVTGRIDQASADEDTAYRRTAAELLARWPVLDDAWHPEFVAMLTAEREAIAAALASSPGYREYKAPRAVVEAAQAEQAALLARGARLERLVRAVETRTLAQLSARRGGASARVRFSRSLATRAARKPRQAAIA